MKRTMKLALLTMAIALVPAVSAQATQTADPTSLKFPHTVVGTESAPLTITYSITADEPVRTVFVGNDCNSTQFGTCAFRQTSTCPTTTALPDGAASCEIQVYFRPTFPGGASQSIFITPSTSVPVSGVGVAAAASKGKKCKKKKGKRRSAAAAKKKKCAKKK